VADVRETFLEEAREILEDVGRLLLELEQDPENAELVAGVFRAAHTLKGAAGVAGFTEVEELTHLLEEVLSRVRDGRLAVDGDLIDLLLEGFDAVKGLVEHAAGTAAFQVDPTTVTENLRQLLAEPESDAREAAPDLGGPPDEEHLRGLAPEAAAALVEALARGEAVYQVAFRPAADVFTFGHDPARYVRLLGERATLLLVDADTSRVPPLPDLDPTRCYVGFVIYAAGHLAPADCAEVFEFVAGGGTLVRVAPLNWPDLVVPAVAPGRPSDWEERELRRAAEAPLEEAGRALEALMRAIVDPGAGLAPPVRRNLYVLGRALTVRLEALEPELAAEAWEMGRAFFEEVLAAAGEGRAPDWDLAGFLADLAARTEAAGTAAEEEPVPEGAEEISPAAVLAELLEQQRLFLAAGAEPWRREAVRRVLENAARSLDWPWLCERLPAGDGDWDHTLAALAEEVRRLAAAAGRREKPAAERPRSPEAAPVPEQTALRVKQEDLDRLMNLAGELVVAKNGLLYLVRHLERQPGLLEVARALKERYAALDRIARDFQHVMMKVRLVPVASLFQRFRRYVRDWARRLGKEVELEIEGEATELDRSVVQAIQEPLVHLVRNALDHGLETPAARLAAGKPAAGRLSLRAGRRGNRVIIEVADDGRGIDYHGVRVRAAELGWISPERAVQLTDEEVLQLILRPGFSTAEQAGELSGRGVGLDAVLAAVRAVKGQLRIESAVGRGTTVRLELPLTMATTRVLLVEAAGQVYGLPFEAVWETVRVPLAGLPTVHGERVLNWRGRLIPVVNLEAWLWGTRNGARNGEERVVVLGGQLGLEVTRVLREEDVILKPLGGELGALDYLAGGAVLGDGSVLLVLDPEALLAGGRGRGLEP
jgi:two-component system chemotaxis sensor kinase CheA